MNGEYLLLSLIRLAFKLSWLFNKISEGFFWFEEMVEGD